MGNIPSKPIEHTYRNDEPPPATQDVIDTGSGIGLCIGMVGVTILIIVMIILVMT